MATLAQIRSSILDQLTGFIPTDDSRLEEAFLENVIRTKRALLVREHEKPGMGVPQEYYQDLSCLEVIRSMEVCDGEDTGIERVTVKIPWLVGGRSAIAYFGKLDTITGGFMGVNLPTFVSGYSGRFCQDKIMYTHVGDELWVKGLPEEVDRVRLIAILEDPAYLKCFPDFEQMEYPMPSSMVHTLETLCLKQLMSTLPITPDISNDGKDGTAVTRRLNPNAIPE